MSNSSLISYTQLSPNCTKPRNHVIDTISIHCMAGNLTVESCGNLFAKSSAQASSNYGIGTDGRIALYVDEANRSWCTSSAVNDHRAVTIEVANTVAADPWPCSDAAYESLIKLLVDICQRNNISKLLWQADSSNKGSTADVSKQNMTVHRWFASKACPGDWLYTRHGAIANEVNTRLNSNNNTEVIEDMTKDETTALIKELTPGIAKTAITDYLTELSKKEVSGWAETIWKDMTALGVFDGKEPQMYTTREQLAKTLSLLGGGAFEYYANVANCPDWMQDEVKGLIKDGFLKGSDTNTEVGKYKYDLQAMIVAYRMYLANKEKTE